MNQLSTIEQAQIMAQLLANASGVAVTKIFIPEYDGGFAAPAQGDSKFYHIQFANGSVVNAGLAMVAPWLAVFEIQHKF